MGILSIVTATVVFVGATAGAGAVVFAATNSDASAGLDIWTMLEKGGAPMAGVLFLALIEVTRRHDRKDKIIEAKDATILAMSTRQTAAMDTANEIAKDQMKIAGDTHALLRELVTLGRGKPDIR